ncbi:hypothetical protein ABK040_007230 [Willaertia magna]
MRRFLNSLTKRQGLKTIKDSLNKDFVDNSSVANNDVLKVLNGIVDPYRSIRVEVTSKCSVENFEVEMENSLNEWKKQSTLTTPFSNRIRAIQLKVDAKHVDIIPICIKKFNFTFHHCKPDYIYLHKWLAEEEKNNYPVYCQHFIGTGGMVVDFQSEEILLIKEKIYPFLTNPNQEKPWKLPGGQLESFELIEEGCCREVFEETGVEALSRGILGLRYKKDFRFDNPDLYFVCLLEPKHKQISHCKIEVESCEWMKLTDYFALPTLTKVQSHARDLLKRYVADRKTLGEEESDKRHLIQPREQTSQLFINNENYQELLYPKH